MLFHRGRGSFVPQMLDIGGDVDRLHLVQIGDAAILAPAQEGAGGAAIGGACVGVADIDGEEFEESPGGGLPCPFD
jgi:hypothetical protein